MAAQVAKGALRGGAGLAWEALRGGIARFEARAFATSPPTSSAASTSGAIDPIREAEGEAKREDSGEAREGASGQADRSPAFMETAITGLASQLR